MPAELVGYADENLKYLVTGIFATWLLFLFFCFFFDFIFGQGDVD